MDFGTIITRCARKLNQFDGTNFVDQLVTQDDIKQFINDRRRMVDMEIANAFPQDFERESYAQNYAISGVSGAGVGGTKILTSNASLFDDSMIGSMVYNNATGASVRITGWTSSTSVTVLNTLDATWNTVQILVLNGAIPLTLGDTRDIIVVRSIAVKYNSTDQSFATATRAEYSDLYPIGYESYGQGNPRFYTRMKMLYVVPSPTKPLLQSIKMRYLELPALLVNPTDTPDEIPAAYQMILYVGALADAYDKREDDGRANQYEQRFQLLLQDVKRNYRPLTKAANTFRILPAKRRGRRFGRRNTYFE